MELAQKPWRLIRTSLKRISRWAQLFSVLNPRASEKELDRAVELNPNLILAYDQYGWTFEMGPVRRGDCGEKKGLELDPLNTLLNTDLGFFYNGAPLRRRDDAAAQDIGVGCEQSLSPPRIGLVFTWERQDG
jgi:hypothetical protein